MVSWSQARAAAWAATAIMVAVAVVQFYALFRAARSVHPPPAGSQVYAVLIAVLAVVAAVVLLIRVGCLHERMPFALGRTGATWVAWAGLGGRCTFQPRGSLGLTRPSTTKGSDATNRCAASSEAKMASTRW